jgi:hypothetical protein
LHESNIGETISQLTHPALPNIQNDTEAPSLIIYHDVNTVCRHGRKGAPE